MALETSSASGPTSPTSENQGPQQSLLGCCKGSFKDLWEAVPSSLVPTAQHDKDDWCDAGTGSRTLLHESVSRKLEKSTSPLLHASDSRKLKSFTPELPPLPWLLTWSLIFFYVSIETLSALVLSSVLKPNPPPKYTPMPSSMIVMNDVFSVVIGTLLTFGAALYGDCCGQRTSVRNDSAASSPANSNSVQAELISVQTNPASEQPEEAPAQSILASAQPSRTPAQRKAASLRGMICETVRTVFNCGKILRFAPVAALFSIAQVFSYAAYSKVDAGFKKILDQLRLPLTAALSYIIVGKSYSSHQWLALLIIFLTVCSFYQADLSHREITEMHAFCHYPPHCFDGATLYDVCALQVDGRKVNATTVGHGPHHRVTLHELKAPATEWAGLTYSFLATFFNCLGSLFSERAMKGDSSTPFPTQKAQLELTGAPVALAMSFIVPLLIDSRGGKAIWWVENGAEGSGAGFFQGFTQLTWIAILIETLIAWLGGLVVKVYSSLVKVLCKSFILLGTVVCSGSFMRACHEDALPITTYMLAVSIACTTVLFATMPVGQPTVQQAQRQNDP